MLVDTGSNIIQVFHFLLSCIAFFTKSVFNFNEYGGFIKFTSFHSISNQSQSSVLCWKGHGSNISQNSSLNGINTEYGVAQSFLCSIFLFFIISYYIIKVFPHRICRMKLGSLLLPIYQHLSYLSL